jgi:hypothetical protein
MPEPSDWNADVIEEFRANEGNVGALESGQGSPSSGRNLEGELRDRDPHRMRIEDALIGRRVDVATRRSALAKYRELLAARLVMSLADLRLKKRVDERIRRQGGTVSPI